MMIFVVGLLERERERNSLTHNARSLCVCVRVHASLSRAHCALLPLEAELGTEVKLHMTGLALCAEILRKRHKNENSTPRKRTILNGEGSSSLYLIEPFCVKTNGLKLIGKEGCDDNNDRSIVMGKLEFVYLFLLVV